MWRDSTIAVLIGLLCAGYVLWRGSSDPLASDFDQLWHGARALFTGANPYEYVGPTGVFAWDYLFYPLPAILVVSPLGLLPLLAARACFAAVSGGVLAFALLRNNPMQLLLFLSAPALIAIGRGQWSPLLTASFYLPVLACVSVAKPHIAVALLAGNQRLQKAFLAALIGGCVLILASFIVEPRWFRSWLGIIGLRGDIPLLRRTGGFLILLALLRWRRPDARLLVALGSVPQTASLYDDVPLFVIPRGLRETCFLAIGGNVAFLLVLSGLGLEQDLNHRVALWNLICLFLPATLMLLRRPNVETVSAPPPSKIGRIDVLLLSALMVSAFFALWAIESRFR